MVDNRVSSVPTSYFKAGDANAMANKMSEEKYGQGGEYFNQELQEEQGKKEDNYHDRSAVLRASLNGLAAANAGSIRFMKTLKKQKDEENKKRKQDFSPPETTEEETTEEEKI